MTATAAIYARISRDDGTELGVGRQIADCTAEAERRGWGLVEPYVDNDVSASRDRPRPDFERLRCDVERGRIGALVVWDADRLSRSPRENEDIITWAERYGLRLANVAGETDLSTPQGRMTFRIKGAVAKHEVEQMSRRIRRKNDERATDGLPHGKAAFGYRRVVLYDDDGRRIGAADDIEPAEAAVIRSTAQRLLNGESLRSIVAVLNGEGSTSPRGKPWNSTTLRQIMLRDRNAGLRRHRGETVGRGAWEAILDADTHSAVVALLTDPQRRTNKGATRKHLLSGIARCGRCGGEMRVIAAFTQASGKHMSAKYGCQACFKVARQQSAVDEYVEAVVVARLSQPDALAALPNGQPERAGELQATITGLQARLGIAADQFADGLIDGEQLSRITAKLRPQIEAAKADLATCSPRPGLLEMTGEDAAERWRVASLDTRRAVIDLLMSVTIHGVGSGRGRDPITPETVEITWRQ